MSTSAKKVFSTMGPAKPDVETVEIVSGVVIEGNDCLPGDVVEVPGWFGRQLKSEGRAKEPTPKEKAPKEPGDKQLQNGDPKPGNRDPK